MCFGSCLACIQKKIKINFTKGFAVIKENAYLKNWALTWIPNAEVKNKNLTLTSPKDVQDLGYKSIQASVPGNFELDFMREGLLEDVYFGANSIQTQTFENLHLYYYTTFDYEKKADKDAFLCFEGIDTVAEIYLDGQLLAFVENMFHAHRFSLKNVEDGKHTLLVHILPVCIYARQFDVPSVGYGIRYSYDASSVRKAISMFGWDIMPRIVSGGLWKPVCIEYIPKSRIVNHYTYTTSLDKDLKQADLITSLRIETEEDFLKDFTVRLHGKCEDSEFHEEYHPFCANIRIETHLTAPRLWWPKNYGKPALYDVELTLLYKGVECDKVNYTLGIRHVWLKRTSRAGDNGEFVFIVNHQKIFVLGTNWVPCDAFPSRHDEFTLRNLELADAIGCNMIRCWGGNVYPSELFYEYCDRHGILIWQDFALACAHYPDDDRLCNPLKEEVQRIIVEKRQHPALALWAGDNECDTAAVPFSQENRTDDDYPAFLNPNLNRLTREIILRALRNFDPTRPYLPSSPYLDDVAWRYGVPAEEHLWGPRDFFKGNYYANAPCHFASEIGYHGCPSPNSIKNFISAESMPKTSIYDICKNAEWLVHAAGMKTNTEENPYAYRLPLMIRQVERIFQTASSDLSEFARQSQISQAEAVKYFIERFRAKKWRKTGILWWNIVDGWPQISDAVVDWYGVKKLAYHYIKRAQSPFCMLFDEIDDGTLDLLAVNDTQSPVSAEYSIINLSNDEHILHGEVSVEPNGIIRIDKLLDKAGGFYLIQWTTVQGKGCNHFTCLISNGLDYENYKKCLQKANFHDEFEGF